MYSSQHPLQISNPAIAAYYFQLRWRIFFQYYIKPHFNVKDYWWRFECQHHRSSHVHGFLWLENAPSIDDLQLEDPDSVQNFVNFWDMHVSTWHPFKACPPAAIHPSAHLFPTLEDTKKELAEMLNRLQRHTYCKPGYCERKKKSTGEKFYRFGFPKENCDTTVLTKENNNAFPELCTKGNDPLLNSYNAGVILGWRANIDFCPVINKEAVIRYVAKYASKAETTSSSYEKILQEAISCLQDGDASRIAYQIIKQIIMIIILSLIMEIFKHLHESTQDLTVL